MSREEIITFLSLDSATEAVEPLYQAGREAVHRFSYNQGRVWAAIRVGITSPAP